MMNDNAKALTFTHPELGITVRGYCGGRPYFLGPDVCRAMELQECGTQGFAPHYKRVPRNHVKLLKHHPVTFGGKGMANAKLITEYGIMKLAKSHGSKRALEIAEWIMQVVIPTMHGKRTEEPTKTMPPTQLSFLPSVTVNPLNERIEELEEALHRATERAERAEAKVAEFLAGLSLLKEVAA
jgi:prophage antirepressor-like protein